MTKDPKTREAYALTLDSFEKFQKENDLTINSQNAEDIVQSYLN